MKLKKEQKNYLLGLDSKEKKHEFLLDAIIENFQPKKTSFEKAVKQIQNGEIAIYKDCEDLELLKAILESAKPNDRTDKNEVIEILKNDRWFSADADSVNWTNKRLNNPKINLSQIKQPKANKIEVVDPKDISLEVKIEEIIVSGFETKEKVHLLTELLKK